MLKWLQQYWGSIVILAVLTLIVGAIVYFHIRAKKQGKSSCGGGCSHCAMSGMCHPKKQSEQDEQ